MRREFGSGWVGRWVCSRAALSPAGARGSRHPGAPQGASRGGDAGGSTAGEGGGSGAQRQRGADQHRHHAQRLGGADVLAEQHHAGDDGDHRGDEGVGAGAGRPPVAHQEVVHQRGPDRAGQHQVEPGEPGGPAPGEAQRVERAGLEGERAGDQRHPAHEVGGRRQLHRREAAGERADQQRAPAIGERRDHDAGGADQLPRGQVALGRLRAEQQDHAADADGDGDHAGAVMRSWPMAAPMPRSAIGVRAALMTAAMPEVTKRSA